MSGSVTTAVYVSIIFSAICTLNSLQGIRHQLRSERAFFLNSLYVNGRALLFAYGIISRKFVSHMYSLTGGVLR